MMVYTFGDLVTIVLCIIAIFFIVGLFLFYVTGALIHEIKNKFKKGKKC